ncbi:MAG: hypothetical protein ABIA75_05035 [Candidatus Neomarinimicrobiota bacterium]
MPLPIIITAVIAAVAVIIYLIWRYEKQRTAALTALAESLKLTFGHKADERLYSLTNHFHLFTQGHSRKIANVLQGSIQGVDLYLMDYRYTIGGGKESHTFRQTVLLFRTSRLDLPEFALRPENLIHRIVGAFGYQDIDFDSHPEFSRQYLLRGVDEEAIRELFGTDKLDYFEKHPKLCTEGKADTLLFYRLSKRVTPDEMPNFLKEGLTILGLFKSPGTD